MIEIMVSTKEFGDALEHFVSTGWWLLSCEWVPPQFVANNRSGLGFIRLGGWHCELQTR